MLLVHVHLFGLLLLLLLRLAQGLQAAHIDLAESCLVRHRLIVHMLNLASTGGRALDLDIGCQLRILHLHLLTLLMLLVLLVSDGRRGSEVNLPLRLLLRLSRLLVLISIYQQAAIIGKLCVEPVRFATRLHAAGVLLTVYRVGLKTHRRMLSLGVVVVLPLCVDLLLFQERVLIYKLGLLLRRIGQCAARTLPNVGVVSSRCGLVHILAAIAIVAALWIFTEHLIEEVRVVEVDKVICLETII